MKRPIVAIAAVGAIVLGPVGLAWAVGHWSSPTGSGSGRANGYALTAPSSLNASESSAPTIHLTWTAPASHTLTGFSYVLTRSSGTITGSCASLTASSVSCDDTGGTVGQSYTYTLSGKVGGWSGPTVTSTSITDVGVLSSLTAVSGTTPQTVATGSAFGTNLAVTAKDSAGDPLSGVSVTFTAPSSGASGTFASGCVSGSGTTCTVTTGSNGVATATQFTANSTASSYSVSAASGSTSTSFSLTNVTYSFTVGTIGTQTAGTVFGGFTVQLKVNGTATGQYNGSAYTGSHSISFGGTAMAASPGGNAATPTSTSLSFNASGLATVPASALTLFKAQSGAVLSVTDAAHSITGSSSSFAIDSAGVTMSFTGGPTVPKNSQIGAPFTVTIPVDAYSNPFTSAAGISVTVTITPTTGTWAFTSSTVSTPSSKTLTITTGSSGNGFTVFESGGSGKDAVLSATTTASGFTAPTNETLTSA